MAAASIVFKKSDPGYSAKLLEHAKSIYKFADQHRDTYTTEINDAAAYYKSWSGYGDELAWAAAWLLRATADQTFRKEVDKHFQEFGTQLNGKPVQFGWDDKTAGVQTLMAQITKEDKYKNMVKTFCDWLVHSAPKTPKGLPDNLSTKLICRNVCRFGIPGPMGFAQTRVGCVLHLSSGRNANQSK